MGKLGAALLGLDRLVDSVIMMYDSDEV